MLLDATEQIMLEQGYAGVTSRSVAERAGVKAPLIHYYFPTLDDLFIAVFRRRSERSLERLVDALEHEDPLLVLWRYANDRAHVALTQEFVALANHRKAIRAEIAQVAERFREVQLEAFTSVISGSRLDSDEFPPAGLLLVMMAIPTVIVLEEALGMSTGHAEATMLVERYLQRFKARTKAPRKRRVRGALMMARVRRRPALDWSGRGMSSIRDERHANASMWRDR